MPLRGDRLGSTDYTACVPNETGKVEARFALTHAKVGVADWRLAERGPAEDVLAAIEWPDGRLVDALLEAGPPVKTNAIKARRDAEVRSGAKSDPGEATVITEYLRLRHHRLDVAQPFSDQTKALRTVVRARDDMVRPLVTATHIFFSALLDALWFSDKELGEQRMVVFLVKYSYCDRKQPAELVKRLRSPPAGAECQAEAGRDAVIVLATVMRTLGTPTAGRKNAAQILAEWGDSRDAFDSPDAIAAYAGVATVTKASGHTRGVFY